MGKISYKQALEAYMKNRERTEHAKKMDKVYKKKKMYVIDENDERGDLFLTSKGQKMYDFVDVDNGMYIKKQHQKIINAVKHIIDEKKAQGKSIRIRIMKDKLGKYADKIREKVKQKKEKKWYEYTDKENEEIFVKTFREIIKDKKKFINCCYYDITKTQRDRGVPRFVSCHYTNISYDDRHQDTKKTGDYLEKYFCSLHLGEKFQKRRKQIENTLGIEKELKVNK